MFLRMYENAILIRMLFRVNVFLFRQLRYRMYIEKTFPNISHLHISKHLSVMTRNYMLWNRYIQTEAKKSQEYL